MRLLFLIGCLLLTVPFLAQVKVSGTVVDESKTPLIGASIIEIGTQNDTITDWDGHFEITVLSSTSIIRISYTGYETIEKSAADILKNNQIEMSPSTALEEIVVTGYGRGRKLFKRRAKKDRAAYSNNRAFSSSAAPPIHNTEDYNLIQENRFHKATDEPQSTFSIDVDAASYSNMRRFLNQQQLPPKDAVRIEELINYFEYEYAEPTDDQPFSINTEVADCPWAEKHQLLHIGLQGKSIPTDDLPASNLVFLFDVSGSMQSPDKLPLLKSSFSLLTDQLRPQDRVAIVVYAGSSGLVLPSTSGNKKADILEAIERLEAGGSTAGAAGIELAYKVAKENFQKGGNNRVILATDGDFNVGTSSDAELVRLIEKKRESGIFLTVLGFGTGNYKDNKMQQLANEGNGNHAYIDNLLEAKKVLVSEFGGTMFTIAKDVKIQIEFNPAQVAGYRLIGYENRLLENEDFEDDTKDAGELGAGHTVTALYEIIPVGVKSKHLKGTRALKYQSSETTTKRSNSNELATVALRYKKPDGDKSQLLEHPILNASTITKKASYNFRFSAAVASFGMLLRDSEFKGTATFKQTIQLAKSAKGKDDKGYRAECIRLMEQAELLSTKLVVDRD